MSYTMDDIERVFNEAKRQGGLDILLEVTQPNNDKLGVIIFKQNKLDTMLEFLKTNYDFNLTNKSNKEIKIVGIKVWRC